MPRRALAGAREGPHLHRAGGLGGPAARAACPAAGGRRRLRPSLSPPRGRRKALPRASGTGRKARLQGHISLI